MNKEQRREMLEQILSDESNIETRGGSLRYKGTTQKADVYKIPLAYLIYNKYNGRISSRVKAYERKNHVLDGMNPTPEDTKVIEDYLWNSKPDRNKRTMEDLVENGQLRYGIVTADGVIIDGNRRASLLNRAYREREKHGWTTTDVEKCRYFNAIILPQNADERDLQQLETMYQMGEDDKLDYNPIEKYLKCEDLKRVGFDNDEIAKMMSVKKSDIDKWLATLPYMKKYLEILGYDEMYPMLDGLEDQFLTLSSAMKDWRAHGKITKNCDWEYTDTDIDDLELICYDYMRFDQEGKEFRRICKTGKEGAIFQSEKLWEEFKDTHEDTINELDEEKDVDEEISEHPDLDVIEVLRARDKKWKNQVGDSFTRNLKHNVSRLNDKLEDIRPREALQKALGLLENLDPNQDGFLNDPQVEGLVNEISSITWNFKKKLKKRS